MTNNKQFDVIIIGGSYAGLSAAMALGRSLRRVLIIDSGQPCNEQTPHSHNFLTQDGEPPHVIARKAKDQVLGYSSVCFLADKAMTGVKTEHGFEITTRESGTFQAQKLIFATGIRDLLPAIPGLADCWGKTVIHCPYCHGYEFRGQRTGIMANGDQAVHLASLVNNLTDSLVIFTSDGAQFTAEQHQKLAAHDIHLVSNEPTEIIHENGQIRQVNFKDRDAIALDALYAAVPFEQHSDIPASLGCELTEQGYIQIDSFQKTTVDGVFAVGDCSSRMRSVANAVATGNFAGAMANMELTQESF